MTTKVTLRDKPISKGRRSLYLDFYPPIPHPKTGEPSRREFLGLYTFEKPKTSTDKHHNAETQKIAESIRQKRENLLNKPEIYSQYEKQQLKIKEQGEINFVEYFRKIANKRKASNYDNWISALHYLEAFTNGSLKFTDLNEMFLEDFKDYLLSTKSKKSDKTTLSQNSAVSYFNKVKATLKQAYKDGILQTDLNAKVSPIKPEETRREHLTIKELNTLAKTPFSNELLKRAVLFSALTGLRFSDIKKMVWSEMEYIAGQGYFINFNQKKTKGVEVYPISEQAYNLTKGKENPNEMEQDNKIVWQMYRLANKGDVKAGRLFLEVAGKIGKPKQQNTNTQNNYIQINGMIYNDEKLKTLKPEQLKSIETILLTANHEQLLFEDAEIIQKKEA